MHVQKIVKKNRISNTALKDLQIVKKSRTCKQGFKQTCSATKTDMIISYSKAAVKTDKIIPYSNPGCSKLLCRL